MQVGIRSWLGAYSGNQLSPGLSVVGKLVPLQLDSQGRYVLLRCRTSHPRHFHCMDSFSHHAVGVQDITPLGSSTSSTRGGSTPFFTSPKGSTNLSTTPFASLSECPFTEADGPSTSGSPVPAPPPTKTQTQQQPRGPTVSFSSAQVDLNLNLTLRLVM